MGKFCLSAWRRLRVPAAVLMLSSGMGLAASFGMGAPVAGAITNSQVVHPADDSAVPNLGVYVSAGNPTAAKQFGSQIGHQPGWASDYLTGKTWTNLSNPTWFLHQWGCESGQTKCHGFHMVWSVPMLPSSGGSLATGAAGAYNSYFSTLAQRMVAKGQGHSVIRLGWEFNGSWYAWSAAHQAANFVAYWRQIVTTMNATPGAAFQFEWCPSLGTLSGAGPLQTDYPGNTYVTLIGADVYDEAWGTYPGAAAEFSKLLTEPYGLNWLVSFAAQSGKQITLGEWGLGWGKSAPTAGPIQTKATLSGGDDPVFINDMWQWIQAHQVTAAIFWDHGTSSIATGQNPKSAAALKTALRGVNAEQETKDRPPVVSMATTATGKGYWVVTAAGSVSVYGSATYYGSMSGKTLTAPIVGIAVTPHGTGYWLVASDGGVFAFGTATYYGSMGGHPLNKPIVGMATTPDGKGYWLVASDGGIFAFGDAQFAGSMGGKPLNKPIVGIADDTATGGYWEVASDGGLFAFNAPFMGSMGGHPLNKPVVSMSATTTGAGYREIASDGGIFSFGKAPFMGSMGGHTLNQPVVGATDDGGKGYWEVASDGGIFSFGKAPFMGS